MSQKMSNNQLKQALGYKEYKRMKAEDAQALEALRLNPPAQK